MTEQEMIIAVGLDNYLILLARHNHHQAGLEMARQVSNARLGYGYAIHRNRGFIPGCTSPDNEKFESFLERMLRIETSKMKIK